MIIINNYCYHSFIHFEDALEKPKRGVRSAGTPQELWAARVDPREGLVVMETDTKRQGGHLASRPRAVSQDRKSTRLNSSHQR